MNVGSLFSGIGGIDLGLQRAGMRITWQVEIDEWCRGKLARLFPGARQYGDIRGVGAHNLEPVDLICGGFPCQPFSVAGKQKGKGDDRYLWPEMLRVIAELRPRWIIGENVAGIVNLALESVLLDLEAEGYEVGAFIIPACAVGAPHRRDRVWIVAYSDHGQRDRQEFEIPAGRDSACSCGKNVADDDSNRCSRARVLLQQGRQGEACADSCGCCEDVPHPRSTGREERYTAALSERAGYCTRNDAFGWDEGELESTLGGLSDGLSSRLARYRWPAPRGAEQYEWEPPSVTEEKRKHRRQALQAYGNAVIPQIPEILGTMIMEIERMGRAL